VSNVKNKRTTQDCCNAANDVHCMCHQAGNSAHISVTELHTGGHSACKLPVRQIWTSEGSQRVVPPKEVPFGGLNDVPLNWGGGVKSTKN